VVTSSKVQMEEVKEQSLYVKYVSLLGKNTIKEKRERVAQLVPRK
jgi:hypothetical protein